MKSIATLIISLLILIFSHTTFAEIELDWGAYVENDLRAAVAQVDEPSIYRNQTSIGLDLKANLVPHKLRFEGNIEFVWTGFTKDTEFEGLTNRQVISPIYLESNAAFIEVFRLIPYLDMKIGRQIVQWGTADMFNPTNNLNALDLEDPLKFGETIANQMIRVDFNPGDSDYIFTAVWVPVFQPAQLPSSAMLQVGDKSAEFPFVSPSTRLEAEKLRNIYLRNEDSFDVRDPSVSVNMPSYSLRNSQLGLKMQWLIGNLDASISYYLGRNSVPVSTASYSTQERTGETNNGTPVMGVNTDVALYYPKKQVLGFDFAGQIPFLDDMGFWFEGAVTFPEEVEMSFDITQIVTGANVIRGNVVDGSPFFKCTAGLDYTINEHLFITGQFIHGFPDEFGAHALNNYWMGMLDIKLLQERLIIRSVVLGEIPHEDDDLNLDEDGDGQVESFAKGATNDGKIGSIVYYPELLIRPLDGLEFSIGAFLKWGHRESKFAMAAAGPSQAFFRAKASF